MKTIGKLWMYTPSPATIKPPQNNTAAANIALRGPTLSTQRPNTAADNPRNTIARLKIQPRFEIDQSPGVVEIAFAVAGGHDCAAVHSSWAIGLLKTLNAYTCPMHK